MNLVHYKSNVSNCTVRADSREIHIKSSLLTKKPGEDGLALYLITSI